MPSQIIAGDASNGTVINRDTDGALTIQTGPNGGKVNALALDASGNGALLGTLTQAGTATPRMLSVAVVATTSGTSVDLSTGIPSWARKITVMLSGVSTSGTSNLLVQLGNGSFVTSGYVTYVCQVATSGTGGISSTAGFIMTTGINAASVLYGTYTFVLQTANTWVGGFSGGGTDAAAGAVGCSGGGSIALAGVLDRLRITTVGGTDTFDAGSANILIEG